MPKRSGSMASPKQGLMDGVQGRHRDHHQSCHVKQEHDDEEPVHARAASGKLLPYQDAPQGSDHARALSDGVADGRTHLQFPGIVTAELQGVAEPLLISSAAATLADREMTVTSFTAAFAKGPEISGSASFPVHCTAPESCTLHFDIRSDDASLARLNQLVNPSYFNRPWYHPLDIGQRHEDALLKLHASGHLSSARFELGTAVANNVSATVEFDAGMLRVRDLRAEILGGRHNGTWTADFTVAPPTYSGTGSMTRVSMAQLGTLMSDNWAAGAVDAQYSLAMRGLSLASLRDSATGSADFTWNDGSLRHVVLDGRGAPLAFSNFIGKVALENGTFTLVDCKLQLGGANYAVKGTASYDRNLDFRLERAGGRSYVISGPLDKPRVETLTAPSAEAALR